MLKVELECLNKMMKILDPGDGRWRKSLSQGIFTVIFRD